MHTRNVYDKLLKQRAPENVTLQINGASMVRYSHSRIKIIQSRINW